MKIKNQRKKTDKVFVEYNDYRDRPFGLKWGTAFAIDELNKVITDNKKSDQIVSVELEQMSRKDIDEILQVAFLKSIKVSIQLNAKNDHGHYNDNLVGHFKGYADAEYLYIEDKAIEWSIVRNIKLLEG